MSIILTIFSFVCLTPLFLHAIPLVIYSLRLNHYFISILIILLLNNYLLISHISLIFIG